MPAWNPLVRVLGDKLIMPAAGPAAGQARLEFNIALRLCSAVWVGGYVVELTAAVAGMKGAEAAHLARFDRNPALRVEILRAMMLGPVLSRRRAP